MTTSGFIQVACSRVQPRKVTNEKKDEINEYKKKKIQKKKEKTKRRAYQLFIYALVVEGDNSRVTRRNPGE
jgi:competence protein ComGF